MNRIAILAMALLLPGCTLDATEAGLAGTGWRLVSLNGQAYAGAATLRIGADGHVSGTGACNRFTAEGTSAYPEFRLKPVAATRRACPDGMETERAYFRTLEAVTRAQTDGRILTLTGETGQRLVFEAL